MTAALRDHDVDRMTDHDLLIRLEGKVDIFLKGQVDHEGRLRVVEAERDQLQGAINTLKGLVALASAIATGSMALSAWLALVRK